ncbi:MAG: hypothetical protein DRI86_16155 [Bacteroidetes bacterium]|nr:MAG: hypothetical protein DRI86_16155 [Bacteroidota bacterium]
MKYLFTNAKENRGNSMRYSLLIVIIMTIFIIPINLFSQDSLHYSHYKYNRMRRMASNINNFTHKTGYIKNLHKYKYKIEKCTDTLSDQYFTLFTKYTLLLSETEYDKAVELTNLKLKTINKKNKNYIELLSTLTKIHRKNRNYVKELETFELLIPINNKHKNWANKDWDEVMVGNIYFNGKFTLRAIYYYKQAINDFEKIDNRIKDVGLAVCYQNIGISEDKLGNHDTAKEYFKKAIKHRKQTENISEFADLYVFIGDNFISELSYDSATVYYSKSEDIDIKAKRYQHLILTYLRFADLKFLQGNIIECIEYNKNAFELSKKLGDFKGITKSTSSLGNKYLLLNKVDSAIKYSVISIAFANEVKDYSIIKSNAILVINALREKEDISINEITLYEKLIVKADSALYSQNIARNELMNEIIKRNNNAIAELAKQELYIKGFYISVVVSLIFLFLIIVIIINRNKIKEHKERQYLTLKQVKELNNDLEEINTHQERTYSVVGHDLKGSLGSTLSLLEILNTENLSKEDTNYYMNLITNAINHTYNLMLDLFAWTRVTSDNIKFSPHKIDLNSAVNDILFFISKTCDEKSIEITVNAKNQCIIYADKNMLDTILRNLLNNAIKFTPRNGKINICISKVNDLTSLEITDNGVGMDDEQLFNLFDERKFDTRVGTENEKGSGLGLKLVKKFASRNNADIKVTSKLKEGTSFTLLFPKAM